MHINCNVCDNINIYNFTITQIVSKITVSVKNVYPAPQLFLLAGAVFNVTYQQYFHIVSLVKLSWYKCGLDICKEFKKPL